MKKIFIYALLFVLFQSCAIIHTPGLNSGYKRLTDSERRQICFVGSVDEIPDHNDGRIMAITALQMFELLKKSENTLLYLWSPHCSSSVCVSLKTIQDFCDDNNLHLFVLTEYYTNAFQHNEYLSNPMLSINEFYYKTSYCNLLLERFLSELIPKEQLKRISSNRFLLFSNENYSQSYEKNEDIDMSLLKQL